jgi:hypothetical protein
MMRAEWGESIGCFEEELFGKIGLQFVYKMVAKTAAP